MTIDLNNDVIEFLRWIEEKNNLTGPCAYAEYFKKIPKYAPANIKPQDTIEWKEFMQYKKKQDLEKDFVVKSKKITKRQIVNEVLKSKLFHNAVIENLGYDYWLHISGRWQSDEKMKNEYQYDFRYGFVTIKGVKVPIAPPQNWEDFEYGEDFDYFIKQVIKKNQEYAKKYENEIADCYKSHPEWI